jgi:hypothetical protein
VKYFHETVKLSVVFAVKPAAALPEKSKAARFARWKEVIKSPQFAGFLSLLIFLFTLYR